MSQIKLITGHDPSGYSGEVEWRDLLEANLKEYCSRWGYDLVMKFDGWEPTTRHVWWRKVELAKEHLADCEWLLWLDSDCFMLNMTKAVTDYTDDSFDLGITGPFESTCQVPACSIVTNVCYSAGVFLLRNCPWSHTLLEKWWDSGDQPWQPQGCNWEGDSVYISCVSMQDPETRERIKVFPLKQIGWANIAHCPSQFIAHCYGSSGPDRRIRFEQYKQHTVR